MPKNQYRRIIDTKRAPAVVVMSGGSNGGTGGTGVTDHGALTGLIDDDHAQYLNVVRGDARYITVARQIIAGLGLTGTGTLASDITLNVGAGTLISVAADTVNIANGAAYQFIGTGSDTGPEWRNVSEFAGNGLDVTNGVLRVGQGNGIIVGVDAITLAVSSPNSNLSVSSTSAIVSDGHTHAIASNSNPGAAQSILATDANGHITVIRVTGSTSIRTPLIDTVGTVEIRPTTEIVLNPGSATLLSNGKPLFSATIVADGYSQGWPITGFTGSGLIVEHDRLYASKSYIATDHLTVRGQLHVYELLIHQIRATNGSIIVANVGKFKSSTILSGAGAPGSRYIINTDPEHGFEVGDLIRAQKWTGNGVYQSNLQVAYVNPGSLFNIHVDLISGGAPQLNGDYVRLGNVSNIDRQGGVYMSADDTGAPFLDVWNGVSSFTQWNTPAVIKVRLGRLDGITANTNEYGFIAGNAGYGTSNTWIKASNLGVELRNVNFNVYSSGVQTGVWSSTGTIALSNVDIATQDDRAFWFNPTAPSLRIGKIGTNKPNLYFDGASLRLRQDTTDVITLSSDGNSYFTGEMRIAVGGGIWQGTGSFASPTAGIKIWNESGIGRIAGYGSSNEQWSALATGVIQFARTSGNLGYDGIRLQAKTSSTYGDYDPWRSYGFVNSSNADIGGLFAQTAGAARIFDLQALPSSTGSLTIYISALSPVNANGAYGTIILQAGYGTSIAKLFVNSNPSIGAVGIQVQGYIDAGTPVTSGAVPYHRLTGRLNVIGDGAGGSAALYTSRNTDGIMAQFITDDGADDVGFLLYGYTSDYTTAYQQNSVLFYAPTNTTTLFMAAAAAAGVISFHTGGIPTSGNQRMVVNQYGVGVGIAADASWEHRVSGNAQVQGNFRADGTGLVIGDFSATRGVLLQHIGTHPSAPPTGYVRLYYYDGGAASTRQLWVLYPDNKKHSFSNNGMAA